MRATAVGAIEYVIAAIAATDPDGLIQTRADLANVAARAAAALPRCSANTAPARRRSRLSPLAE